MIQDRAWSEYGRIRQELAAKQRFSEGHTSGEQSLTTSRAGGITDANESEAKDFSQCGCAA
jgi:hypothetical protein